MKMFPFLCTFIAYALDDEVWLCSSGSCSYGDNISLTRSDGSAYY